MFVQFNVAALSSLLRCVHRSLHPFERGKEELEFEMAAREWTRVDCESLLVVLCLHKCLEFVRQQKDIRGWPELEQCVQVRVHRTVVEGQR